MVTTDLMARARAGDAEAFRQLIDPHRRQFQVHCYRILGSVHDAQNALQETLLAAWPDLATFEGRASIRTWLHPGGRQSLRGRDAAGGVLVIGG